MDADYQEHLANIDFGLTLSRWFEENEVGRYIVGVAKQDVKDAILRFMGLDRNDVEGMQKIYDDIHKATRGIEWINEQIMRGVESAQVLSESDGG